jgi:uncharacterized membrane protein YeaQ/YmgE (transglycosylase-associated protein family)
MEVSDGFIGLDAEDSGSYWSDGGNRSLDFNIGQVTESGESLEDAALQVVEYLRGEPIVTLALSFVVGFGATETVSSEWSSGVILWLLVGFFGLFVSQFTLLTVGLEQYLNHLPEFRIVFDLLAGYLGSFFVAATFHFLKPL